MSGLTETVQLDRANPSLSSDTFSSLLRVIVLRSGRKMFLVSPTKLTLYSVVASFPVRVTDPVSANNVAGPSALVSVVSRPTKLKLPVSPEIG